MFCVTSTSPRVWFSSSSSSGYSRELRMVVMANCRPSTHQPSPSITRLNPSTNRETGSPVSSRTTSAMPVVPQLIRFAGSTNSFTDSAYSKFPTNTIPRQTHFFQFNTITPLYSFEENDKLLFVALTPNFLSLRDQSADWSWQSPG